MESESGLGTSYTPAPGDPGFVAGANASVTYNLISDVPEPGTLCPAGGALLCAALARFRRPLP